MDKENDYEKLTAKIRAWHEEGKHEQILTALDTIPRDDWDYPLTGFYARALNNLERYGEALDMLLGVEREGRRDGVWHFRVGYALYYLNREKEAAEYFQKAIDYGDDGEDTRRFLAASREEARRKEERAQGASEMYTAEEMVCLQTHIEKYFGKSRKVFHELVSPDIHVDIFIIEPAPGRNYYVLVTIGMGAHRMNVPEKTAHLERAELLVCLPPDWRLDEEAMSSEEWYWPLRWLAIMARLPGGKDTWLGWGHTVTNDGNPFAPNTRFTTMMLVNPGAFDEKAGECLMPGGSVVNFYQTIPLYEEEAQFKLKIGAAMLLKLLDDEGLVCVNLRRRNVCGKG
jgi:hypothetical protein